MSKEKALKEFVKGGGAIFIGITLGYIFTFFAKLILSRYLGPDRFGLFEMLTTFLSVGGAVGGLALYSGINRFIPYYESKGEKAYVSGYMRVVTYFQLGGCFLLSFFVVVLAERITAFFDFPDVFTSMLYVIALTIPLLVFTKSFSALFFAYKKSFIAKTGVDVIQSIMLLVGASVLYFFELSVFYVVFILFFSWLVPLLFFLYKYYSSNIFNFSSEKKFEVKRWLLYSVPLLISAVVAKALSWTDNFVVGRFLTSAELGIYGIVFSVAFYLFAAPKMFSSIFLPILTKYYEKDLGTFKKLFNRLRSWSLAFASFIGMVFIFFNEQILTILFGSEYAAGGVALAILSGFFIVAAYFYYFGKILHLHEDTTFILWINICGLIINLFITILLVREFGIVGAALGTGFTYILIRFITFFRSRKFVKLPGNYLLDISFLIISFVSMLISYYSSNFVRDLLVLPNLVYILIAGGLYIVIFALLVLALGLINKDDIVFIEVIEDYSGLDLNWLKKILV